MSEFVLTISTLLQFVAAGLAFRLCWMTRRRAAWVMIATAVLLMAFRRSITLSRVLLSDRVGDADLVAELVALLISVLMVVGILLIRPYFQEVVRGEAEAARFGRVLDESLNEIYIFDSKTFRFVTVNHGARANLGYSIEELRELTPWDIKPEHTAETFTKLVDPLLRGEKERIEFRTVHRRKDGTDYPVDIRLQRTTESTPAFVAFVVDISERVRAEEIGAKAAIRLRQRQRLESVGTLAGGVAHEINNPISGIMNYAQLIDERLDPGSPLREFATGISRESERVAEIVRNLLSFARQDKDSHSLANISDIVNDTVSLMRTIIRRDQITLEVDIPDGLPKIKCRSQQVQQVLMNLLTNARDALNSRYPDHDTDKIMRVSVKQFERSGRRWFRITVEDHGTGVPEEIRDHLFDPFFTTKDRSKGTGLGLSISHGIVRDHQGELRVESEPGEPTRFLFELPVDNGWSLDRASSES